MLLWACSLPMVLSVYMCMYVHLAVCVNYGLVSGTCFNNILSRRLSNYPASGNDNMPTHLFNW